MSEEEEEEVTRSICIEKCKEKQNDQDFKQKMGVMSTLLLEFYRVLMGAFLIVFVPQKCGDSICSMGENMNRNSFLAQIAISFNALTMLSFLILYFIEVKRENKLITYLEVNRFTSVDNDSVGEALKRLSITKKNSILKYDGYYQKAGYLSSGAFIFNSVFSAIIVYKHYYDSKSATVFLTNILFMGTKVADVYSTVNTKKNVFYSAYLKQKVQFNDVDPDKLIKDNFVIENMSDSEDSVSSELGQKL